MLFGSRFFVQWVASERHGRVVVPITFWYLSFDRRHRAARLFHPPQGPGFRDRPRRGTADLRPQSGPRPPRLPRADRMSAPPDGRRAPALEHPALAIALVAAGWLVTAGALGLLEPTETRYGEIAREMLASGDWLAPRLDGIHHFHKPPLAYWSAAGGMALFGVDAFGARLGVVLASIVTRSPRPHGRRRGASWRSRSAADVRYGCSAPCCCSPWWVARSPPIRSSRPRWRSTGRSHLRGGRWPLWESASWRRAPWCSCTLALPVLITALLSRDTRVLRWLGPRRGWWLFAAIALPWYLMVVATHRGLLGYFLGDQLWEPLRHHRASPRRASLVLPRGAARRRAALDRSDDRGPGAHAGASERSSPGC